MLSEQRSSRTNRSLDMTSTTASQEELKAHRIPLAWRDQCSAYVVTFYLYAVSLTWHRHVSTSFHVSSLSNRPDRPNDGVPRFCTHSLLLPLNVCRKEKYYLPWECENERHAYEKYVLSSFFCCAFLRLNSRSQVSIRRVGFLPPLNRFLEF